MDALKKLLLILFCAAFFAVRTKMSHDIEQQINYKLSHQVAVWDNTNISRGEFVKK